MGDRLLNGGNHPRGLARGLLPHIFSDPMSKKGIAATLRLE